MDAALSPALAHVLRSARPEFNARFAAARRVRPALDGPAFAAFLRSTVDPLVRAVERTAPDRVSDVVLCAYDLGLELLGQGLAGPAARDPSVEAGWRRVAPAAAALVAAAPERVLAALANAPHLLAGTPGAQPEEWMGTMEALAPRCADVDTLLRLGQVAAWRAGMAHFRAGALAAADALPEPLALAVLGAPPGQWPMVRQRLAVDPWFDPARPDAPAGLRVVARAGAFRGFGGLFTEPPRVAAAGGHFLAGSGGEWWLLAADAFGATFQRATPDEVAHATSAAAVPGLAVNGARLTWNGTSLELPELGPITGVAANGTTAALTARYTHAVTLVSLA
ncbi:hypothetical protein [Longimicrobium sp.]|uniref:hypothetical protein n=1 Tax=Longimicrobium sp. TaxID=2029185 RepID=UPI003B3A60BF